MTETPTRCGYVAIIGAPNAGKSTLVNTLVGAKVTIVSRKVQTTRALVRGIVISGPSQIVLVDTPGIFVPRRRLDRAMVRTAWGGAEDADIVAVLIDAERGLSDDVRRIMDRVRDVRRPRLLILNKIDRIERAALLALTAEANALIAFERSFMISATRGDGVEAVVGHLAAAVPPGPWLFPEDQISDVPMRMLAAEITREKVFERLHEELPYASTVETDSWTPRPDGSVTIEQTLFVERESQRKIALGKAGATIKAISTGARKDLEGLIDRRVHLFLHVKVRDGWADDPERYREMGLEFPRDG